jgi:hypothetical protein
VHHTNHLVAPVKGGEDTPRAESFARLDRLKELTQGARSKTHGPSFEAIRSILSDGQGGDYAICRNDPTVTGSVTLFSIAMRLARSGGGVAELKLGKPNLDGPIVPLGFGSVKAT